MPFAAPGTQKVELVRSGATQVSATSPVPIAAGPVTLFNYDVATAYAESGFTGTPSAGPSLMPMRSAVAAR
jgi:hypothetical protein